MADNRNETCISEVCVLLPYSFAREELEGEVQITMKEKLNSVVNVERDDKNPRTMNEMRRNRSQIVARQLGL